MDFIGQHKSAGQIAAGMNRVLVSLCQSLDVSAMHGRQNASHCKIHDREKSSSYKISLSTFRIFFMQWLQDTAMRERVTHAMEDLKSFINTTLITQDMLELFCLGPSTGLLPSEASFLGGMRSFSWSRSEKRYISEGFARPFFWCTHLWPLQRR